MCGASAHVSLIPSPKEARSGHILRAHKFFLLCHSFVTKFTLSGHMMLGIQGTCTKGGTMKRITGTMGTVLSVLLVVFCASGSHAQNTQGDTKEYVSSSPAFTLSYPAEWVEQPLLGPVMRMHVGSTGPTPITSLAVNILYSPLEDSAQSLATGLKNLGTNVRMIYDKPSQLKDGAPAREAEFEWVRNWAKLNTMMLAATNGQGALILADLTSGSGRIGDDLKKILYSLEVKRVDEKQ